MTPPRTWVSPCPSLLVAFWRWRRRQEAPIPALDPDCYTGPLLSPPPRVRGPQGDLTLDTACVVNLTR